MGKDRFKRRENLCWVFLGLDFRYHDLRGFAVKKDGVVGLHLILRGEGSNSEEEELVCPVCYKENLKIVQRFEFLFNH